MPLRIRPLTPQDIPAVAALRGRVFRQARRSGAELEAYLRLVFFHNPWMDDELAPLVAEENGAVAGFIGIVPRPLTRDGQAIRGAVATQMMVAPEHRGIAGLRLVQAAFAGAQDVLYADVVNPAARSVWELAGGSTAPLAGFQWVRPLRPARHAAAGLGQGALVRGTRFLAGPLFRVADTVATPRALRDAPTLHKGAGGDLHAEPMDGLGALGAVLPRTAGRGAIIPVHAPDALAWLLERARERWPEERVQAVLVRGAGGDPLGGFVYLDGGAGTAQVLHLFALPAGRGDVLRQLFRHAWRSGAAAVRGRAEAPWLEAVAAAGCQWERLGEGMIVHARRPELLAAFLRGDAVLGGLDGEWWMDF